MASKVNYFKIGIFVVSAIVVLIIFTIALGLGSLGKSKLRFETYIDESVQGLNIGSPVKHRGVQIGRVEDITFVTTEYDLKDSFLKYSRYVLVVIAADDDKFNANKSGRDPEEILDRLIEKGLRIRLTTQALTGIAYLEVDYFDPQEYLPLEIEWEPKYKYIPSAASALGSFTNSLEQTFKQIASVDFVEIVKNFNDLLVSINSTLEDARIVTLVEELRDTNIDLKDVIQKASVAIDDTNVKALSDKLGKLLDSFDNTAGLASETISGFKDTNTLVQNMLRENSENTTTIPELIKSVDNLVNHIDNMLAENRTEIEGILNKLDYMSTDLVDFSNNLKQNPSILLFSKEPTRSEVLK